MIDRDTRRSIIILTDIGDRFAHLGWREVLARLRSRLMAEDKTKWERLQSRFKSSWLGAIACALIAISFFTTKMSELVHTAIEWVKPSPAADLMVTVTGIAPIPKYQMLVVAAGENTIYPVGATIELELRHNGGSDEQIRINSMDVLVKAYSADGECPFKLVGDRIIGAGSAPVREFTVQMAGGFVKTVQLKMGPDGPAMRGSGNNLLDLDPPLKLTLDKADSVESAKAKFIAGAAEQYTIGLSIHYTSSQGSRSAEIKPFTICNPKPD
jgi:hypothetical protein